MTAYVYETTCTVNGMTYTGCTTTDLEGSSKYIGSSGLLYKDIRRFGRKNFTTRILFKCASPEIAYQVEKIVIGKNWRKNNSYNAREGGGGYTSRHGEKNGFSGKNHTDETKKILSRNNAKHWKGKKLSKEHREKISKALRGRKKQIT